MSPIEWWSWIGFGLNEASILMAQVLFDWVGALRLGPRRVGRLKHLLPSTCLSLRNTWCIKLKHFTNLLSRSAWQFIWWRIRWLGTKLQTNEAFKKREISSNQGLRLWAGWLAVSITQQRALKESSNTQSRYISSLIVNFEVY